MLHWGLAFLLVVQFVLGLAAEHCTTRTISEALLVVHFRLGVLILGAMLVRLALRLVLPVPKEHLSRWRRNAKGSVHGLLYLLVLALPISGHVIWVWMGADRTLVAGIQMPALFTPPNEENGRAVVWYVHVYGAWALLGVVCLHATAAGLLSMREPAFIARRIGFGRGRPQSD
ncbi:cytochrome b/b6 domain-containing protein [Pseudoxanthomonas mexicana]|uniref:Cytochrome b/b6 domain-containing protein n=1 Tax=Pseudoxanthomonas mexicana TaxID=128785 RepID=A0A7G9TE94_PSEMX|nr:cytochrome b/b6 domain-containing protein [Pseudoxanthomonas mexicana]